MIEIQEFDPYSKLEAKSRGSYHGTIENSWIVYGYATFKNTEKIKEITPPYENIIHYGAEVLIFCLEYTPDFDCGTTYFAITDVRVVDGSAKYSPKWEIDERFKNVEFGDISVDVEKKIQEYCGRCS
jgi:hypothetical protein